MSTAENLGWKLRIGWGVGSLGATTLINGVTFIALFYLTGMLGMSPALAGSLLFAAKLFDILTDPLMGWISDRTRSPVGRRRPYLLLAAFICGGAFLLLFNAPQISGTALTLYVLGTLLLYTLGYTMFNIPYLAMPAEMTSDYHERSQLMSARVVFAALGILAGGSLAPTLISWFGGQRDAYASMAWVLAALITVSMLAAFFGTRRAAFTEAVPTTQPLAAQWRSLISNQPFMILMGAKFLHMLGVALVTSALLFLVTAVLQREAAAAAILGLASTAGTLASVPLWLALSKRLGKRNTYLIAVLVFLPASLSWLFTGPAEAAIWLPLRGIVIGIATAGLTLTAQAMLPDTIDYDARRSGLRREGLFTAGYSFMEKSAFALGPLIFGALLQSAGYTADSTVAISAESRKAILLAVAVLPAIASALSALLLIRYKLDADYLQTRSAN